MPKYICKIIFLADPEPLTGWRTYLLERASAGEATAEAAELFRKTPEAYFGGWCVETSVAKPEPKTPMSKHGLKVTIDDGYCAHEYPVTSVPGSTTIHGAALAFAAGVGGVLGDSKLVRAGGLVPCPADSVEKGYNYTITIGSEAAGAAFQYAVTNASRKVSILHMAQAAAKDLGGILGEGVNVGPFKKATGGNLGGGVDVWPNKRTHKPGDVDTLFRSGDDKQDAIVLLDCAYDIMEIWKAEGPYNQSLQKAWMQRARELGAVPSP